MDRYFYTVEENNGRRIIHLLANIFRTADETRIAKYKCAEWTFFCFAIDEAQLMLDTDTFYEYANERVNYLGDYTEIEAFKLCKNYFNGQSGAELHILDITDKTPCGNYWFDA